MSFVSLLIVVFIYSEIINAGTFVCYECPYGLYSWVPGDQLLQGAQQCNDCPEGAMCGGGDKMTPLWGTCAQY